MKETILRKQYGLHLVLDKDLAQARGSDEWLEYLEEQIGTAMKNAGVMLLPLELETNQPAQIKITGDQTLKAFKQANNLFLVQNAGRIEIGTEVMLKSKEAKVDNGVTKYVKKSNGQKFVLSLAMAEQLGHELLRMAKDMEGASS